MIEILATLVMALFFLYIIGGFLALTGMWLKKSA